MSAGDNKSGKKTTLFVVLGLIVIVYIVGVVAFSQVAYPNTTIAGVDVSFSNASSAATKVNSAWKHYKLIVTGDDFSWTYQPESDEPIVDGEAAAKEIINHNEAFIWPVRLVESLSGKTKTTATSNEVDLDQDVDLSMLSDTFDQKQFEKDLGAAIDEFNEGRSGTFEANSSYDEQAGKFTVEKARSNEKLNREHVIKYAELELASLAETVDLSKLGNDAYEPLNGTLTDDQIQAACDAANNFLGVNVTLKLNGEDAGKVDGSSVLQWISFADPANPTLDTSQISSWAAELANGFNTVGSTRWWTRADGKQCAVEGGDFGWSIDSSSLAKQVEDAINNKQTGEIEIKYSQKADTFTAKGEPDWKAYIDVDLSEQHARYYDENGNIVWEANFISGKPGEDATPEGVWQINSNDGGSTLIGAKDPETGKPKYYGRFNQGVVTINLVDVALSSGGNFDKFWKIFDERLALCHRALQARHQRLLGTPSDAAPILWQYGALARLKKGEKIDKLLYGGYSTISLGYAGLYECVKYMTGKSHTDAGAKPFALSVMQHMNDKCSEWKKAENMDYSLYGTPLESTTYKFAKCLQKRFGIVPGITDKNYITNSYHVHVSEQIDAFTKLKFESEFQKLSPGGAISYVEVPNMQDNLEAVMSVLQFIYDNIMYAELNTKSDYCQCCGYDGEIKIVEDDGKLVWECPKCGNRDQNKLNVARRTCGYIGTQFWNQGRTQEIKDRVLHL